MNEALTPTTNQDFEHQFQSPRFIETETDPIEAVELSPENAESDVPIMLLGGFGTDMESTKLAAKRLYDAGRRVVLINHPSNEEVDPQSVHKDIHPFQNWQAGNVNRVAEALGHEKYDMIAQSGSSLYATAAALKQPEKFRTLVIESGAGLTGEDKKLKLMGRFAIDAIVGTPHYMQNAEQLRHYSKGMAKHIQKSGPKRIFNEELPSIAESRIDRALAEVRESGVKVAVIEANSDKAFPSKRIDKHIHIEPLDESAITNADAWTYIADKKARHGALLFDQMGVDAALDQIRQFEKSSQLASTESGRKISAAETVSA